MIATRFFHSRRALYAAVAASCLGLLGFGYYLQFFAGQEACPLCVFQRLAFFTLAVVAGAGAIHGPLGVVRLGYGGAMLLAASAGAAIAGRQVWLQHLPADQVPECGPGLDYMLDAFPLAEALRMVFSGSGECAEVGWTFMTLSIAEWSLLWFVFFIGITILHCHGAFRPAQTGGAP